MQKFLFINPLIFLALFFALPPTSKAGCSKEDVQFYLDKGFTQEQITELCSASEGASVPDYQPYQQKVIIYSTEEAPGIKDGFTKEEREAIKALETGGDVINLKIDQEQISYTRRVCIMSASSPEYDQRYRDCPEVDFIVGRKNLKAASSGKTVIVFGSAVVAIEGDIQRELQGSWEDYPASVRKELERNFNWKEGGNKSNFPVRGDFSVTRIVNAIRTLSIDSSEVNSDEIAETNPTNETNVIEIEPTEKKKKKWWNPFD